jgi:DNA primase
LKTKSGLVAKEYLLKRGFKEEVIDDFQIGVALDEKDALKKLLLSKGYGEKALLDLGLLSSGIKDSFDQLSGRIIIPLQDASGKIIGFTGRIYRNEDAAKYINTKETVIFKKGNNLYNYFLAKEETKKLKSVILVEGQMDAIRLSSEGFKNVMATGGTSLTKEQIELLKKLKVKIILCLDNDNPGLEATYRIGEELIKNHLEVYVIRLTDAKDPDEYIKKFGSEAFQNNLKALTKYFDFKIFYLKNNKDLNNAVDLAKYINDILEVLKSEQDDILKELTLQKLSKEYNIDLKLLKDKLGKITTPIKKEVITLPKVEVLKKDKYSQACEKLLFYMMNDRIYIKMYQKQLGFIPFQNYRNIANEILYFYDLNKMINMADFISFVSNKADIYKTVLGIINENDDTSITESEMELFIQIIKEYIKKEQINKLKENLKNELDINKKVAIATKIAELKKEVEK